MSDGIDIRKDSNRHMDNKVTIVIHLVTCRKSGCDFIMVRLFVV